MGRHELRAEVNVTPLVVAREGGAVKIWWGLDLLADAAALRARAVAELAARRPREIFVKADANLSYGDVYPVLATLHAVGGSGAHPAVREAKEGR